MFDRRQHLGLLLVPLLLLAFSLGGYAVITRVNLDRSRAVGTVVDEFNGVKVYYNGGVNHSAGRNLAADGYNLGMRYQCVEFVKRYYYERFGHEMPEARGNARDFFDPLTVDGTLNRQRGLLQFRNGSVTPPRPDDILVLGPGLLNPYGHVAVVSRVSHDLVEVVQQNGGPFASSRRMFRLLESGGGWRVDNRRVRGWLRLGPGATLRSKPGCIGDPWLVDVLSVHSPVGDRAISFQYRCNKEA